MKELTARRLIDDIEDQIMRGGRGEPSDFPALPDVPTARYADQQFWDIEQQHLWTNTWLFAGHLDEIPEIGNYKLWDESGVPIVIVRGKDHHIRAYLNVCQHRGGPLVVAPKGTVRALSCKFHGWTYDLKGALTFVPDEQDFPGMSKAERSLKPLRCELWGNFIFINRSGSAPPLHEWLGPLKRDLDEFGFEHRHIIAKVEYELGCNWKAGIGSNIEAYHLPTVHPNTVSSFLDNHTLMHLYRYGHSRQFVPYDQKLTGKANRFQLDYSDRSYGQSLTGRALRNFVVSPNLLIAADEYQFPIFGYWPNGIHKTRMVVYYTSTTADDDANLTACKEMIKGFDAVLEEDRGALHATQEAYRTQTIKAIKLGSAERRLYHLEEEIDRAIGIDNTPEAFRVKPMTARYINEDPYPDQAT